VQKKIKLKECDIMPMKSWTRQEKMEFDESILQFEILSAKKTVALANGDYSKASSCDQQLREYNEVLKKYEDRTISELASEVSRLREHNSNPSSDYRFKVENLYERMLRDKISRNNTFI
jgi:hypothetical protein